MSAPSPHRPIYACVKDGRPHAYRFPWRSFTHLLRERAATSGAGPALVFRDLDAGPSAPGARTVITYGALDEVTARLARVLHRRHGIGPGDRVSLALPNCPEVALLTLALFRLGATSVPLDLKRDVPQRKRFKIADSGSRLVCALPGSVDEESAVVTDVPVVGTADLLSADATVPADFEPDWSGDPALEQAVNIVLYTSGTTGNPKGVLLTRQSLVSNADGIIRWLGFSREDRLSLLMPLHHVNSTVFSLTMLMTGGSLVLNSRYSVHRFWPVLAEERATATSIVPTIMQDLLHAEDTRPHDLDLRALRKIMIGSAPVPPGPAARFVDTFGVRLVQGYGTTEVSLRVTGVPPGLPDPAYREVLGANAIGLELANSNVTIENDAAEGELGEILVRGPVVAGGYLNQPEATAESFCDGWFRTGDLGCWRTVGGKRYFFIHGRKKEIIIKGGVNISPIAVENALVEGAPDVQSAYVVGVDSERYGEDVCAVVVLRASGRAKGARAAAGAIARAGLAGAIAGLSPFEAPCVVLPFDDQDLPKTSTGKVQRAALRDIVAQRLAAQHTGPSG